MLRGMCINIESFEKIKIFRGNFMAKKILIAMFLNLSMALLEIIGGVISGSLAGK